MKKFETIKEKEVIKNYKKFEYVICELCNKQFDDEEFNEEIYDFNESEVKCRIGQSYPSDSFGDIYEIDICPKCFVEKLIPWVESQGGKAKVTNF